MTIPQSSLDQAGAALAVAQERLALAVETTGLTVWDWDYRTNHIHFEAGPDGMLGYPETEEPRTLQQSAAIMHNEDRHYYATALAEHLAGKNDRMEYIIRMRHASGEWRYIHSRGRIVERDAAGSPVRLVGTFADVTERQQDLADQQFMADLMLALIQSGNPAENVNAAVHKLARYLKAERAGVSELSDDRTTFLTRAVWSHSSLPAAPKDHRSAYNADLIAEVCNNGVFTVEDIEQDPRVTDARTLGLYRDMEVRSVLNIPMQAKGSAPIFLYLHSRKPCRWTPREIALAEGVATRLYDHIFRARAERDRASSNELLTLALDIAKLGAFERNLVSGDIRLSKGFFNLIGHPDIRSGTLVDYIAQVHPDDRDRLKAKIAVSRQLGNDHEVEDEHRILTADGAVRSITYRSKTHFAPDEEGKPHLVRAVAIIQDVTEQKERMAEAEAARDHIHKLSRLTAMGTMASTLAHELNQPLAAAANYLNALKAIENSDHAQKVNRADVLEKACQSVLDAGNIIKRIRNFTSDGTLLRKPVMLKALVDAAIRNLDTMSGCRLPEIAKDIPDGLSASVDEVQIEQVISNLMRNAAEAMADRKGALITLTAQAERGGVSLCIADNGPGIPDAFAAKLFSPFQSGKRKGMGLGLSLCRTIVEAHGGHLTLERHGSDGCEFRIRLPAMKGRPAVVDAPAT